MNDELDNIISCVRDLDRANKRSALKFLYNNIDSWLWVSKFDDINTVLGIISPSIDSEELCLGALTISSPEKGRMPNYDKLSLSIYEYACKIHDSDYAKSLMRGLEGNNVFE
jgi:hypothetical protein